MSGFFDNKFAIVMGGSEGIGLATAVALVQRGAGVAVGSRNPQKLAAALRRLETARRSPGQLLTTAAVDVTDEAAMEGVISAWIARHGAPDILINSAGFARPGYLDEISIADLRRMMDVNYFGVVHAVKAALPAMRGAAKGHIVNVSSVAGFLGLFGYAGYCASKYAVIGFSEALRQEVRPYGIGVSVICPPNTRTPGLAMENKIKPQEVLKMEETVKTVPPELIANAIVRDLPKNKFFIHANLETKLVHAASRWFPGLTRYAIRRPSGTSASRNSG